MTTVLIWPQKRSKENQDCPMKPQTACHLVVVRISSETSDSADRRVSRLVKLVIRVAMLLQANPVVLARGCSRGATLSSTRPAFWHRSSSVQGICLHNEALVDTMMSKAEGAPDP